VSATVESFYPKPERLTLILMGMAAFTAVSLWILVKQPDDASAAVRVAAWVGVPFCGGGSLYFLSRLLMRKPSVVLNAEGIYDNSHFASWGMVPWGEIDSVAVRDASSKKMVGIYLRDTERVLSSGNLARRLSGRLSLALGWPPICIPVWPCDIDADDLAEKIRTRLGAYRP